MKVNSQLHAVNGADGRLDRMFLSGGHTCDYIGARALVGELLKATTLLADRGYDADWFLRALDKH